MIVEGKRQTASRFEMSMIMSLLDSMTGLDASTGCIYVILEFARALRHCASPFSLHSSAAASMKHRESIHPRSRTQRPALTQLNSSLHLDTMKVVFLLSLLLSFTAAFNPTASFLYNRIYCSKPNLRLDASSTANSESQKAKDDVDDEFTPASSDLSLVASDADSEADSVDYELGGRINPDKLLKLPNHSHAGVNDILKKTEAVLTSLHRHSSEAKTEQIEAAKEAGRAHEAIYANNYVDLGKIDTVGFDFDYTLVT